MRSSKVIRSAGVVGGFTLLSRGLGLVRDILMAGFFGTSLPMSAFVVAFTIPNLFRRLFGEGALSAAFVPVFVETREKEGADRAWQMARVVTTLVAGLLLFIVLAGIAVICLGMRAELGPKAAMVLPLLRIMLPYMLLICLAALSMGILNSCNHFAIPAATPSLLNIVWIAAVALVCPRVGGTPEQQIYVVAWAIIVAGVIQLGAQIPVLLRHGYRPGFSLDWKDERVRRIFFLMGPAALGMAVTQVNVMFDRLLAMFVGDWASAALFFSERLIYFPLGIFGTAMATVLLPVLSRHAARGNAEEIRDTIQHSLRNLLFLMVPASIGLLVLAEPIVRMIFEWKTFTTASTAQTAIALQFYAPGLLVFSLAKIFVPSFYAQQDTWTPVKVSLQTVAIKLLLSLVFVLTWPVHLKHAGLAFATVLAEAYYGIRLAVLLHRRIGSPGWSRIFLSAGRIAAASVVMGVVAVMLHAHLLSYLQGMIPAEKVVQVLAVLLSIAGAMGAYGVTTLLFRCSECGELWKAIRR